MFYFAGICISLFLCALLFGKKDKTHADKILTAWVFFLSVHLFLYYCSFSSFIQGFPFLFGLHFPLPLLHGPFLYLYTASLTKSHSRLNGPSLVHFLPTLVFFGLFVPFYLMGLDEKTAIVNSGGDGYQPIYTLSIICTIVSGLVYVLLTGLLLRQHQESILNQFSYTEKIELRWLQYLTYGIGLIWILIIFTHDELIFGAAVIFIMFIGYFGIRQAGIFTQTVRHRPDPNDLKVDLRSKSVKESTTSIPEEPWHQSADQRQSHADTEASDDADAARKYYKSGLSPKSAEQLHKKMRQLMSDEKVFKEPDLSLASLADKLDTNPNYLSQVINEMEGKNFYDYVNGLRTHEFLRVLSQPESNRYTLLALALECGFSSKSSFNRNFKRIKGQTPSHYLNTKGISGIN